MVQSTNEMNTDGERYQFIRQRLEISKIRNAAGELKEGVRVRPGYTYLASKPITVHEPGLHDRAAELDAAIDAAMETSNEVQSELAGDYADNSSTEQLRWFIDYEPELERVNKHRGTNWTQEMLNEILYEAIAIRERHDANAAYTAAVNLYAEAKDVYYAARDTYYESRNALNTALRAYNESKETWSLEPT